MQRVITEIVSDLSGEPAETLRFNFGSGHYEVDLTKDERHDLMRLIQPYIEAGRKVGRTRTS